MVTDNICSTNVNNPFYFTSNTKGEKPYHGNLQALLRRLRPGNNTKDKRIAIRGVLSTNAVNNPRVINALSDILEDSYADESVKSLAIEALGQSAVKASDTKGLELVSLLDDVARHDNSPAIRHKARKLANIIDQEKEKIFLASRHSY